MSTEAVPLPAAEQIRRRVHQMWGSVAESWGEHFDHVEHRAEAGQPAHDRCRRTGPR